MEKTLEKKRRKIGITFNVVFLSIYSAHKLPSILVMAEGETQSRTWLAQGKEKAFIVKARNEPSHTFSENHVRHIEMVSKKEEK